MEIRCLTFDLDNTLWAIEPVIHRAEEKFFTWLGTQCPAITARYSVQTLTEQRQKFYHRFPNHRHNLSELRKQWLAELFADNGCAALDVEAAFHYYWCHRNDVELFDGVHETLEILSRQFRIGAITNGNACVERIGIDCYFDFVISSERVGVAKPAAGIFEAALLAAGMPAHQVAHIGDDPKTDVLGASAAGLRTIWFNPPRHPWPGGRSPDAEVQSLAELHDALERL